jgi:integrase
MAKRKKGEGTISWYKRLKLWEVKVDTGRLTPKGHPLYRTAYAATEADAVRIKRELLELIASNALPERAEMTVSQLLDEYLEGRKGRNKGRTVNLYERDCKRFIKPRLGNVKLVKLSPLQIERMQSEIRKDASADAARRARDTLSRALRQAVRWRLIPNNPAEGVEPLKVERAEMSVWEPDEVRRFLETARQDDLYALFYLALTTGMRQGELLALRWSDITLSGPRASVTVRASVTTEDGAVKIGATKTLKSQRRLSLAADQVDVLSAHMLIVDEARAKAKKHDLWTEHHLVFPSSVGTVLRANNLTRRHWLPLRAAAGVPEIRFHDLRHTYASMAIRAGMDVRLLADRLGHRDPAFTLRQYVHVFEKYRQSGALSLDSLLQDPLEKTVENR